MQNPPYIAVAIITPFLTFCFFWLLETIKSAKEKKDRNVRALRAILSELLTNTLLNDMGIQIITWEKKSPIKFNFEIWQSCCGNILIPEKNRDSLEIVYSSIHLHNQIADWMNKMANRDVPDLKEYNKLQIEIPKIQKRFQEELSSAIKDIHICIERIEEESTVLLMLKEFFGPSHRIVRIFQDFPNKSSSNKE